jgi:hypothetical protein
VIDNKNTRAKKFPKKLKFKKLHKLEENFQESFPNYQGDTARFPSLDSANNNSGAKKNHENFGISRNYVRKLEQNFREPFPNYQGDTARFPNLDSVNNNSREKNYTSC